MTPHNRIDASWGFQPSQRGFKAARIEGLHALGLVAVILALAACATPHKPAPVTRPPAKPLRILPAAHARAPAPAAPAPTPAPTAAVLDSRSYEQDKNRIKQALANNSSDALAPAEVGYYIDVLQGRLKQVTGKSIGIGRKGDRIVLDLSGGVAFESGSAQINAGIHQILTSLSKVLVEYRMTMVSVQVRSDDAGAHAINPGLAEQRALAIAHDLADAGVAVKRIVIAGVGPEHRMRVEMQLEPIVRAAGSDH